MNYAVSIQEARLIGRAGAIILNSALRKGIHQVQQFIELLIY